MSELIDFFEADIPSKGIAVLEALKNEVVAKVVRYSFVPIEEDIQYLKIKSFQGFGSNDWPLLLTLTNGLIVGFLGVDELASIWVWVEVNSNGEINDEPLNQGREYFPVEIIDPVFSNKRFHQIIGQKVNAISILKAQPFTALYYGLPLEVGILLKFENGIELVLLDIPEVHYRELEVVFRQDIPVTVWDQLEEIPV